MNSFMKKQRLKIYWNCPFNVTAKFEAAILYRRVDSFPVGDLAEGWAGISALSTFIAVNALLGLAGKYIPYIIYTYGIYNVLQQFELLHSIVHPYTTPQEKS